MIDLRKTCAGLFCVAVLGAQTVAVFVRGPASNAWYWPFMDYPMYSSAHDYSDAVSYYELRGRRCDSAAMTIVSFTDLHMDRGSLQMLLFQMSDTTAHKPRAGATDAGMVNHLLVSRAHPAICTAQLWEYRHGVGWNGYLGQAAPPRLVREWEVPSRLSAADSSDPESAARAR